ncbi:carboxyltransferase domain-containing protein [Nesterenkonia massiliensis]|uniref:carboxyltransferase domain-containing protein n=1 Tax=Nesterenkonia massiliensis TaxID=1232429 RepID=UPI00040A11D2|nr:carboxyltransferase domain-containing protein [Nesterenkonia massiliensis]
MVHAVLWTGQRAVLVEFGSLAEMMPFQLQFQQSPLPGQREVVAAERSIMLDFRTRKDAQAAVRQIRKLRPRAQKHQLAEKLSVEVLYEGAELDAVAEELGMSRQALIDWHVATDWISAFTAAEPGLMQCVPGEQLNKRRSRKSTPPVINPGTEPHDLPAGAVVLAGVYSGIWPRANPGTWRQIGHLAAPPAPQQFAAVSPGLIPAGTAVKYRPVQEQVTVRGSGSALNQEELQPRADAVLEVLDPGEETLIQDLGRIGCAGLGVPPSGALDTAALRQANQLVGNEDAAAGFEVLGGGLRLLARQTAVLAVTGAEVELMVTGTDNAARSNMALHGTGSSEGNGPTSSAVVRQVPQRAPFWLFPGEELELSAPNRGLRSYVAVSGGLAVSETLGSASTDTHSALGPGPVTQGQSFALVGATSRFVGIADVSRTPLPSTQAPGAPGCVRLRFVPGPREELFAGTRGRNPGLAALVSQPWSVLKDSSRSSVFLTTTDEEPEVSALQIPGHAERAAEPVPRGAVLITPEGMPVLCLADYPVVSEHPVIGVVVREDLGLTGQLSAGTQVDFVAVDPTSLIPIP